MKFYNVVNEDNIIILSTLSLTSQEKMLHILTKTSNEVFAIIEHIPFTTKETNEFIQEYIISQEPLTTQITEYIDDIIYNKISLTLENINKIEVDLTQMTNSYLKSKNIDLTIKQTSDINLDNDTLDIVFEIID